VSWLKRDARPHPEERGCTSAPAKSKEHARVSKDEDGHGAVLSCFKTHRIAAESCKRLCSRCDAPQHEGQHILAKRNHAGRTTNLRLQEIIAGCDPLFPACYLQGTAQLQRVWHVRA
jgi:hypothetical protein